MPYCFPFRKKLLYLYCLLKKLLQSSQCKVSLFVWAFGVILFRTHRFFECKRLLVSCFFPQKQKEMDIDFRLPKAINISRFKDIHLIFQKFSFILSNRIAFLVIWLQCLFFDSDSSTLSQMPRVKRVKNFKCQWP